VTSPNAAPGNARRVLPPWWPGVAAWALWARLLRQAGRPDLVQFTSGVAAPTLALVSAAAVGAVLASRRPAHPVGWLLLALALSLVTMARWLPCRPAGRDRRGHPALPAVRP